MIYVQQNQPFEDAFDMGTTGLVGTFAVEIIDNIGNIVFGPVTTGVVETPVGSGIYGVVFPAAPAVEGQYTIVGSSDGSFLPDTVAIDDLVVTVSIIDEVPVPLPPAEGALATGPCSAWVTADEVAACCDIPGVGTFTSVFDDAAIQASLLLFAVSGRQFAGICGRTIRPCRTGCGCWGSNLAAFGGITWQWTNVGGLWQWRNEAGNPCGCEALSQVKLPGYPVRAIAEVKIDGVQVSPTAYRLDGHRWLTRLDDPAAPEITQQWPGCQNLALADTEVGTWSVSYTYGLEPPLSGKKAAGQLACELYKACAGQECSLPSRAVRVIRQGVTVERALPLADLLWKGQTGMILVDAFIAEVNPAGLKRRPAVWSPTMKPYGRVVG